MNILDDKVLGTLVDSLNSEEDQCDLNEELLNRYDRDSLFFSLSRKMSKYEIQYYIDKISIEEKEFWFAILNELIKVYKLNPIKTFITSGFIDDRNNIIETVKLLAFVKYNLQDFIIKKVIKKDTSLDDMFEFAKKNTDSKFFKFSMEFIDLDSFNGFMNVIFKESEKEDEEKI